MDEICSIPSCHRIEDIKDCTICKPSAYFCGDCFDNHECAVYSKSNPCPENFRCGFKTCYKEFYTPCTNCKPNTYWCQDCFTKHKCSTTDSDEGEAEDENDDCDKSSDYSTYNCSICNLSWTYVSGTDPGSCDNCAENNLSTESTIKYNNSSVTENYFVAESTNNYDNSSSTQDSSNSLQNPANQYSIISGHYYIATSLLRGDYDKLRTIYYCLSPTDKQYLSGSRKSDVGLISLAKIAVCFNSRDCANLTNKLANGMSHNSKEWFLPIKFEGINNNPIFKFTREPDHAILVALNINGRGTPYGLWLKPDGSIGIEGSKKNPVSIITCLSVICESLLRFRTTQDFDNVEYEEMATALIKYEPKCNPKLWEAPDPRDVKIGQLEEAIQEMSTLIDKIQVDAAKKFATIEKETKKKAESHDKNIKLLEKKLETQILMMDKAIKNNEESLKSNKQLEKSLKQQQLKRPIIMSKVEEGHSPVKKKQDKVGRKGKTEVIDKTNNSSSTTYENISDVQYQQRLTEKEQYDYEQFLFQQQQKKLWSSQPSASWERPPLQQEHSWPQPSSQKQFPRPEHELPPRLHPPRPFPIHQTPPTMTRNPQLRMNSSQITSPVSERHRWDSNSMQHQHPLIYPPPTRPPLRNTMSQQYESRYKGQQYSEQEYSGSSNFVQQEELEDYYRR